MSERKAIFVTGGGSGIGRAIARKFAGEGWRVGLGDIDQAGMDETAQAIGAGDVFTHRFDVRDRAAWDEALAAFAKAAGRIDVLANNAGIPLGGSLSECSPEEIERCLDINLKGMLWGAQAVLPHLQQTAPGSALINTASAAGVYGTGGASVYSATKFGVRGMTESLDAEWSEWGITVASICPSFIETPLLDHAPHEGSNESIRQRVAAAGLELTSAEDVAQAAWDAAHGDKLHWMVGKTARQIAFAAKWLPGRVRKRSRGMARPLGR